MRYLKKSYQNFKNYQTKHMQEGILLNSNESPFLPSKKILDEFHRIVKTCTWNRYPDINETDLRQAISKAYEVEADCISVGVGSDELIDVLFRATLEKEDCVLSFSPTFSMYQVFADLVGAKLISVFSKQDYLLNKEDLLQAIKTHQPKMVLLCLPNNPTGQTMKRADVIEIIEATKGLVILDLAYEDFAQATLYDLALRYDNVIALKTFSKAFALPSIRLGVAFSTKDNKDMIQCVKPPYTLNTLTQIMGKIAIEHRQDYREAIELIRYEREYLRKELSQYFKVYPSEANFLFCEMSIDLYEQLLAEKIYIRKFTDTLYRITIGSAKENKQLLKVVKKYAPK